MIKVYKDLNSIPESLKSDEDSILKDPAKTTHMRRLEVIADGCYPSSRQSSNHDKRYKYCDIKNSLYSLYHSKCAFCETRSEMMHVEHFRPKRGGYYWLAYSWDNLLLSCPSCNTNKGDCFPLSEEGKKVVFENTVENIKKINILSSEYEAMEKPLLVNPELVTEEELKSLSFSQSGEVSSCNLRMNETIQTCNLNRKSLCESRKIIWDRLKDQIHIAGCRYNIGSDEFKKVLVLIIDFFKTELKNDTSDYIAFRKYILSSNWIREEIKKL